MSHQSSEQVSFDVRNRLFIIIQSFSWASWFAPHWLFNLCSLFIAISGTVQHRHSYRTSYLVVSSQDTSSTVQSTSHSYLIEVKGKFFIDACVYCFCFQVFCVTLSATEWWCCDNRCFLSSSVSAAYSHLNPWLLLLSSCLICAFLRHSSIAALVDLEMIRNGTNTHVLYWLLKAILLLTLSEVMVTIGHRAMQEQN